MLAFKGHSCFHSQVLVSSVRLTCSAKTVLLVLRHDLSFGLFKLACHALMSACPFQASALCATEHARWRLEWLSAAGNH